MNIPFCALNPSDIIPKDFSEEPIQEIILPLEQEFSVPKNNIVENTKMEWSVPVDNGDNTDNTYEISEFPADIKVISTELTSVAPIFQFYNFINDRFEYDDDDFKYDNFDDDFDEIFKELPDEEFDEFPDPYKDDEDNVEDEEEINDEMEEVDPFEDFDDLNSDENTFDEEGSEDEL